MRNTEARGVHHTFRPAPLPADRAPRGAPPSSPGLLEWPPGCLGYAVNLVRPVLPGQRSSLLYSQLGRTLVFETMDQAAAYRTYVTQVRRKGRGRGQGQGFRWGGVEGERLARGSHWARGSRLGTLRPAQDQQLQVQSV